MNRLIIGVLGHIDDGRRNLAFPILKVYNLVRNHLALCFCHSYATERVELFPRRWKHGIVHNHFV